jgi:hypothetical protein
VEARRPGQGRAPAAGIDDQVGFQGRASDDDTHDPPCPLDEPGHAAGRHAEPMDIGRRLAEGTLVGDPPRAHAQPLRVPARKGHLHGLGTEVEPPLPGLGPFRLQQFPDLRAERVGMGELHRAPAPPGAVRGGPRVAVDGDDTMAPPGQRGANGQAGRPGADHDHVHGSSAFDRLTAHS